MSPDPVAVGANINALLIVRNDGPGPATGVLVTDTLPPNTVFVSATPEQGTCLRSGQTVTCSLGNLAVGAITNIRMVLQATAAAAGTTLVNTATVTSNEFDVHPEDNTATATVFVLAPTPTLGPESPTATVSVVPSVTPAPLRITKTGSPASANVGDLVTYTVTVTNPGTTPVPGVTVTDTLPANAELVSATATAGTCTGTVTLVCTIGTLGAGQSATVTIVIRPTPAAAGKTPIDTAVATAPGLPPVTTTATTPVLVDLIGRITCNVGTPPGFVAVLSRRLSRTPGEPGSFSLLGLRADRPERDQVLPGDLTLQVDQAGNFHFTGLSPSTTFTLTILTLDGTVVVRETVSTPATGQLHFSRSVNCLGPFPLLPPLLPPPPLIPAPPSAIGVGGPPLFPEVPVIPEADSLLLLDVGLAALGTVVGYRRWRGRKE
jgi:uncharacterized repeat protein (TIGR01451 family)